MDFEHGRKNKDISLDFTQQRDWFFKPSPADTASAPPVRAWKERKFTADSGASLHVMSESDLTPEEQETILLSKEPSVTMTANGTAHTTEEAPVYVCDLDKFVQYERITRGILAG